MSDDLTGNQDFFCQTAFIPVQTIIMSDEWAVLATHRIFREMYLKFNLCHGVILDTFIKSAHGTTSFQTVFQFPIRNTMSDSSSVDDTACTACATVHSIYPSLNPLESCQQFLPVCFPSSLQVNLTWQDRSIHEWQCPLLSDRYPSDFQAFR